MSARVLVLGAGGGVGHALLTAGWPEGTQIVGLTRAELDVTDASRLAHELARGWGLVVNAAAYTAVDAAEADEQAAYAVNAAAVKKLGEASAKHGFPVVHISTDYVFDGRKATPYTEADSVAPLGAYGRTKAEGERYLRAATQAHLILRTSWVFSRRGPSFVKTMLKLSARPELRIVDDQHGRPTPGEQLARCIAELGGRVLAGELIPWGTYHLAGSPPTTWYGFAQAIFRAAANAGVNVPELRAIPTEEYPLPAPRPSNSDLDCGLAAEKLGLTIGPWEPAMQELVTRFISLSQEQAT